MVEPPDCWSRPGGGPAAGPRVRRAARLAGGTSPAVELVAGCRAGRARRSRRRARPGGGADPDRRRRRRARRGIASDRGRRRAAAELQVAGERAGPRSAPNWSRTSKLGRGAASSAAAAITGIARHCGEDIELGGASGLAGAATTGRLGAAAVWDEFAQETSESELAAVPSCHGSVPNRYAAKAPCSAITIAIRNNSLAHFSRAAPGHFSRALKR
jgi:hypothetical protein